MNLLYTLTAYPPSTGGAQLHHHQLAQYLNSDHNIQVISIWDTNRTDWLIGTTLLAPNTDYSYIIDGINVQRLGLSLGEKIQIAPYVFMYYPLMEFTLPRIAAYFEKRLYPFAVKSDLIHNVRIGREGLSYASAKVARQCDIPFILTPLHHPRWTGFPYKEYLKLYKDADLLIALTKNEKETLISLGVDEIKITITGIGPILANSSNPNLFLSENNIEGPMILFLGQHYRYKGYMQLLKATTIIWRKVPDAHFVFIGPQLRNSKKYFQQFRNDSRIRCLGNVNLKKKTDALAACNLLCVPSTQESFGGVYTEAWSYCKPVIGCNIPAVSEVISNGIDGFLVEQDPKEIADRICFLLLRESKANDMGKAGFLKVKRIYNWERLSKLTEEAYLRLL